MEPIQLIILFLVSIFAGMYGVIAGGPSLVTIPTLIFFNVNPIIAIASNRVGFIGTCIAGLYQFHVKKNISYKLALILALPALIGSFIGAKLIINVDEGIMEKIIGIFTLSLLIIALVKPNIGLKEIKKEYTAYHYLAGIILSFLFGIYGGFYGAGIGTFISYVLVFIFGETFFRSAGTNKIPLLLLSLSASLVFFLEGIVVWSIAITIFLGSFLGSYISAAYADRIDNKYIKYMFLGVAGILGIKLLF